MRKIIFLLVLLAFCLAAVSQADEILGAL